MADKFTLREWRHLREFSCDKVAEICGVHVNTYRNWEQHPDMIPIRAALKMAKAFGTCIDDISFVPNTTKCGK